MALLLWKFKFIVLVLVLTKGKLLLLGLTKSSTLLSMLRRDGGVLDRSGAGAFALGLRASRIYVHEMGHVAALRRYGIKATAPMFIPGFGAFVRLKQYPANRRGGRARRAWRVRSGGSGPRCSPALVFLATGRAASGPRSRSAGAWLNLFNLIPVWQLDGGRGYSALSSGQRLFLVAAVASAWVATNEGLLLLIGLAAAVRLFGGEGAPEPDRGALAQFLVLITALSALAVIPVPGLADR